MNNNKILGFVIVLLSIVAACTDEIVKPVLQDSDTFTAPVLLNGSNDQVVEFTAENGGEQFEVFEWETSDYGVNPSVRYIIEADIDETFADPAMVKEVQGSGTEQKRSIPVLNNEINNAMLSLGLTPGEEASVHLRIFSFINGINRDTLFSNAIVRKAIPFRSSDCGTYCTVGIVGSATPGGWDIDTDMRWADPEGLDKNVWTITVYLNAGAVKFRAQDAWEVNWGSADFPSGIGTNNGVDIPITTPGYYKITLDDRTGAYTFTPAGAMTFASVGVIGQQSDWSADIADLTKDGSDPHIWTGTIALNAGEVKFRANDSWDNNWGAASYPSGYSTPGGANIVIPVSGTYFIYFNDATGEYFLGPVASATPFDALGLIGSATPGGWDADTDLIANPANPYKWSGFFTIGDGAAKFRADNSWDVNWGASTFPGGTGAFGGADIPVQAGTYFVTFNTGTGEYYFLK